MKRAIIVAISLLFVIISGDGCAKKKLSAPAPALSAASAPALDAVSGDVGKVQSARMLIWTAELTLEVKNETEAAAKATELVKTAGGYIEEESKNSWGTVSLKIRVPVDSFARMVADLEKLGTIDSRSVKGRDVTEEYIDVEARLKNKMILRDSLKTLLAKAVEVKDVLAVEEQLNRVQGDIDSMEGRIKLLKGQADLATIDLKLNVPEVEQKPIYGPLGYLFKGLWWGVKKLFIIRS